MASTAQPSPAELTEKFSKLSDVEVYDAKGGKVKFGSVYAEGKTVVVFIRHFFCGSCMQYVGQLTSARPEALQEAGVKIAVVGCGEWKLIQKYKDEMGFTGEIYANPDRSLYRALGMVESLARAPAGEEKRSYLQHVGIFKLTYALSKNLAYVGKQGNIAQNGGEFVLGPGSGCHYGHIMQHSGDHVEVSELMKAAGVAFP
ncbi:AhpC/TSA antioxidant enzyme-domain-containing protein [Amylostereum chailletii]|nr:AhpC/TSA antioxidant enzyme-domain-containing protein [Amylostereum chailletii]